MFSQADSNTIGSVEGMSSIMAAFLQSAKDHIVPNEHFFKPQPPPPMPWELSFDERKRISHDPKFMKQVADEAQWKDSIVAGIWQRIRRHSLPHKAWLMTHEEMTALLNENGITSSHLSKKLCAIFDAKKEMTINGLIVCKVVEISLTNQRYQANFLRHCFDKFDRPPCTEEIDLDIIRTVQLANPADFVKKGSKKGKSILPLATKSGATHEMVSGLKAITDVFRTENPHRMTYDEFRCVFLDPDNVSWVGSFLGAILEGIAAFFAPPVGSMPYLPLRWLATTAPLETEDEMYDADVILLREIEANGGIDPNAKKKKAPKEKSAKATS